MPSVAVITDTDSSLPADISARYKIHQVPISIIFGSETYDSNVDINDAQVFARIDVEKRLPTTSAPSTGKFAEAFQAAFDQGHDAVVCICVSSEVSATYNAAMAARDLTPGLDITVIDSYNLSLGQGFMVLAAAEAASRGAAKEEVISAALEIGKRTHYYAALATLKYLAMSGRVGYLAAGMATILNIRPILTIKDGKLQMLEKIRTRKKSLAHLVELISHAAGNKKIERLGIIHVTALEEAREFEKFVRTQLQCPEEILMCELSAGLSVHSGAGMIGVSLVLGD